MKLLWLRRFLAAPPDVDQTNRHAEEISDGRAAGTAVIEIERMRPM